MLRKILETVSIKENAQDCRRGCKKKSFIYLAYSGFVGMSLSLLEFLESCQNLVVSL